MQTAFRKMGNSVGVLVPKAFMKALGAEVGTPVHLTLEDGKLVAMPLKRDPRAGWAEDAARIAAAGDDDDCPEWRTFGTDEDADWTW